MKAVDGLVGGGGEAEAEAEAEEEEVVQGDLAGG